MPSGRHSSTALVRRRRWTRSSSSISSISSCCSSACPTAARWWSSTVVEHFVAEHPQLPEEERAMLLGWRDVVEGIFRVQRRDGDALVAINLVDDLTYRVRSNRGPAALGSMRRGMFLITRLVPIGGEWLLSGA